MDKWISRLQKNKVFKFISSVRLAVPLMLVIGAAVAAGTLYESRYNAQVARLMVYQTFWFRGLMLILWTNIFAATVSRYPFKEHHIGFVVTHIGLLTLLAGAQITAYYGVDGSLRVPEGQSNNVVMLSEHVIKVASPGSSTAFVTIPVKQELSPRTGEELGLGKLREETGINVDNYLPFVTTEQVLVAGEPGQSGGAMAVAFTLQSPFFTVNESLNSQSKPEMQMGPAHLKLVTGEVAPAVIPAAGHGGHHVKKSTSASAVPVTAAPARMLAGTSAGSTLIVKDATSNKVLTKIAVSSLTNRPATINGITIQLVKVYQQAMVAANKLGEGGNPGANPALELHLQKGSRSIREVSFAKFPSFSMNPQGTFGLKFEYQVAGAQVESSESHIPMHGQAEQGAAAPVQMPPADNAPPADAGADAGAPPMAMGAAPPMGAGGNTIEFHASPSDLNSIHIVLSKKGELVLDKTVKIGEALQTPWMGLTITVNSIQPNGVTQERIKPTEMQPKHPLPPSAIFVRSDLPGAEGAWITEGDSRSIQTSRGNFDIYYGDDMVNLPFNVKLDQFRKLDYPGTEMALSFESTIRLNEGGAPMRIQMNEPLQHEGYLLYQSSYEMGQGIQTASIFSVNKDPGRWIKYIGAIILIIGIVLFTTMRSKLYVKFKKERSMRKLATATALLLCMSGIGLAAPQARADEALRDLSPEGAQQNIVDAANKIDVSEIRELPVQSHGRVKPLDSLARETILFITGKYSMWGVDSTPLFLAISTSNATAYAPLINVRDPDFRVTLGFKKTDRYVSLQELANSPLESISRPILAKQEKDEKSVTPDEKKIIEVVQQAWLLRQVLTGSMFENSAILDVSKDGGHGPGTAVVGEKLEQYLGALRAGDVAQANLAAMELIPVAKVQPMPDLFRPSIGKLHFEVLYNHIRPFFWVGIFYILIGVTLVSGLVKKEKLTPKNVLIAMALPGVIHIGGFLSRIYITGFAPVTNMYGTMVWVAFGVMAFGTLLFALYKNHAMYGLLLIGSSALLLLTESIPLILSPDMDPIVAVLRNNFWLTIHVLTISISYAAFTIAMLVGNSALIRAVLRQDSPEVIKNSAHFAYRAIQLGVFLLTTGIILGGWWADYSWGRFWGWDPKETWALIADLGFIAILHARYVGWLGPFGVLAAAPMSYLLVIMAWYGVNFILAAGLHSYGFSSGGTMIVIGFVSVQAVIFAAGMI